MYLKCFFSLLHMIEEKDGGGIKECIFAVVHIFVVLLHYRHPDHVLWRYIYLIFSFSTSYNLLYTHYSSSDLILVNKFGYS